MDARLIVVILLAASYSTSIITAPTPMMQESERLESPSSSIPPIVTTVLQTQEQWNISVNGLAFLPSGRLAATGMACAMTPTEYEARSRPACNMTVGSSVASINTITPAYIGVIRSDGVLDYTWMLGSGASDSIDAILPTSNNKSLIGGSFCWHSSSCSWGLNQVYATPHHDDDAFIGSLALNGSLDWIVSLGSSYWDNVHSLAEGPNGELYALVSFCIGSSTGGVNGCGISIDGLTGSNVTYGGSDLLLIKLSPAGTPQWARSMGSPLDDHAPESNFYRLSKKGIVATDDGGVIIAGSVCEQTPGCEFKISGTNISNGSRAMVAKFDGNGDLLWVEDVGGSGTDYLQSITELDANRVVVVGNYWSSTFSVPGFSVSNNGNSDAWWGILNHSSRTWEGLWDSTESGDSYMHSVAVGPQGEIIMGGSGCWSIPNCSVELAGLNHSGLNRTGFLIKVDDAGNGDWIFTVKGEGARTPINLVVVNDNGDIGAAARMCADSVPNCAPVINGVVGSRTMDSSVVLRILQDEDRDGIYYVDDNCPTGTVNWTSDSTSDYDGDGCRDSDQDPDDDGDLIFDNIDDCPLTIGSSTQDRTGCPDTDGDGWSDPSTDWGSSEGADVFINDETQWSDADSDGVGDNYTYDIHPSTGMRVNQSGDALPDDPLQWQDMDGDGWGDNTTAPTADDCPTIFGNSTEGERLGCPDRDGDGWSDQDDDLPDEPTQWVDSDSDGFGEESTGFQADHCPSVSGQSWQGGIFGCPDRDGDGWPDSNDSFPDDAAEHSDLDSDGIGDVADACPEEPGTSSLGSMVGCTDSDLDGFADEIDGWPSDPSEWSDLDGDGFSDQENGTHSDDCPTKSGLSSIDKRGCPDYDVDGWSNDRDYFDWDPDQWNDTDEDGWGDESGTDTSDNCPRTANADQEDHDSDGLGDACDDDDDGDGVDDANDLCRLGELDWESGVNSDFDADGCRDPTEDADDDGDGVMDADDFCKKESLGWYSNPQTDHDADGCSDEMEDVDDDNDGVSDGSDACAKGVVNWTSSPSSDHDADGCDDIREDNDDDNDMVPDERDSCPRGFVKWVSGILTDADADGCYDGLETPETQGSGEVTEELLPTAEEKSFGDKLRTGDLDAFGLLLAILLPLTGVFASLAIRSRRESHIRSIQKRIRTSRNHEELEELQREMKYLVRRERLSMVRYELLLEDVGKVQKKIGPEISGPGSAPGSAIGNPPAKRSSPPSRRRKDTVASPKPAEDESFHSESVEQATAEGYVISVDDDGYEWTEDGDGVWWYRDPDVGEWMEWET